MTTQTLTAANVLHGRRTLAQRLQSQLHAHPWLSPAVVLVAAYVVFSLVNERFAQPGAQSLLIQQTAVVAALAILMARTLKGFEVRVLSAHRTPAAVDAFVAEAPGRGAILTVTNPQGGEAVRLVPLSEEAAFSWAPGGDRLAFSSRSPTTCGKAPCAAPTPRCRPAIRRAGASCTVSDCRIRRVRR